MTNSIKKVVTERDLLSVIKNTSGVKGKRIPLGNKLESKMNVVNNPVPGQQPGAAAPGTPPVRNKGGRPRTPGSKYSKFTSPAAPAPGTDPDISPAPTPLPNEDPGGLKLSQPLNALGIPMMSKKLKRDAQDLFLDENEIKILDKTQPYIAEQRSWPAYIITAISMIIIKYYQSEEIRPAMKVEKETGKAPGRQFDPNADIPVTPTEEVKAA
jgi:hypothetical protein